MKERRKYNTKFYVDPDLEKTANKLVNSMGTQFILEGAVNLGGGDVRIWTKNIETQQYEAHIFPLSMFTDGKNILTNPSNVETPKQEKKSEKFEELKGDDVIEIIKT